MITTPSDYIKCLEAIQKSVTPTIEMIHLGTEPLFIINTDTREITVPPAMHQLGVVSDHNAETIYLQINRYFDDADLSQKTCVIQYINAADEKHLYPITEKYIDEEKGKLTFAWKLSGNVTKTAGIISFSVRFYEIENDAYLYNFNTKTASFMISDGLDIREDMTIVPSPTDIIILVEHLDQVAAQTANDAQQTSEDRVNVESLANSVTKNITDKKDGAVKEINTTTSNQIGKIVSEGTVQINKIKQKGNDTLESIPNDYVQVSRDVSDLKYKDIRNSSMFSNALIGEVTGEEQVVINDAANATIPYLEVDGVSEQVVTTGAQLLDLTKAKGGTSAGITIVVNKDGSYTCSGTATEGNINVWFLGNYGEQNQSLFTLKSGTYYKSGICLFNGYQTIGPVYDGKFTLAEDTSITCVRALQLEPGKTYSGVTVYPMLNAGDTALPWEPYTGGKPSPSPEYPQEIVSIAHVANSGAQLFDASKIKTRTIGGATVTNNGDGSFTVSGNGELAEDFSVSVQLTREETVRLFHAGDYTLSGNRTYPYAFVKLESDSIQTPEWNLLENVFTKTVTQDVMENENVTARLGFYGYARGTIVPGTSKPMFNAGNTTIPWEPYNSQNREIDFEIESKGANLLAYPYDDKIKNTNGVTFTPAKDGSIVIGGTATDYAYFYICQNPIQLNAGSYVLSGGTAGAEIRILKSVLPYESIAVSANGKEVGFTLAEKKTVIIDIVVRTGKSISTTLYPMLIVGSMPLPWEPYHYQKVTIPLAEPLRGISDVKDRFCMHDGVWGIERRFGTQIFDGRTDEKWVAVLNNDGVNYRNGTSFVKSKTKANGAAICTTFAKKDGVTNSLPGFKIAGDASIIIYSEAYNTSDVSLWTAYLAKNPMTIVYELATPTWEPFPESTQAALNALTAHPGTTYLTVTSTDVSATMRLEYVQDINKVITQLYTTINELKASLAK